MRLYPNWNKFQYEEEATGKIYTFVFDGVEFYRLICWDGVTETTYFDCAAEDITWSYMKEAILVLCKNKVVFEKVFQNDFISYELFMNWIQANKPWGKLVRETIVEEINRMSTQIAFLSKGLV
ncbi:MAG: hypothetical protein IJO08_01155 [Clostridia bacterium]|nr:hypothetical protein [Clostridia bacterium]